MGKLSAPYARTKNNDEQIKFFAIQTILDIVGHAKIVKLKIRRGYMKERAHVQLGYGARNTSRGTRTRVKVICYTNTKFWNTQRRKT